MSIPDLIRRVEGKGYELFWQGRCSPNTLRALEETLGVNLPPSFVAFLSDYGGGGVVGDEISGVEDDDAKNDNRGTVYGDTKYCREEFELPPKFAVIYLRDDEVIWCLDTRTATGNGECGVVSYDPFPRRADRHLFPDFNAFLVDYLTRYAETP